ncbi:MAG: lysophospholipid acyltransferase family protein [Patescibacteria group bacterium]
MAYTFFKFNIIPLFRLKIKRIEGLENIPRQGNYILAANHNAWIDSPYIWAVLTKVINEKIYAVAATKKFRWMGAIPIDPKNKAKTVDLFVDLLKKGKIVAIFPEGNSNPNKILREPKTGVARLALRSKLPVIPIGIKGTKGRTFIPGLLRFFFTPARPTITVGRPMTFPEFYGQTENEYLLHKVSRLIMQEISKLCGKKMPPEDISL